MQISPVVLYRIDKDDEIIFANEAWDSFALQNDAPDMIRENILNRSLWNFIKDDATRNLYREILELTRAQKILQFKFSCDSPDKQRFMEMTVSAEIEGGVQFQTRTLQIKERAAQKILDRNALRTKGFIYICSWCKAIDTGVGQWKNLDEAIDILGLFNREVMPGITHGICGSCYHSISEKIAERKSF